MPHYWSELFTLSLQLFEDDELTELKFMIKGVEEIVFTGEQIASGLSLYDLEMAIESNPDYYSYFEREDNGQVVSKFDVERHLNRIKVWIFERVRMKAQQRRFARFR
jgi:hypothetical protein